MKLSNKILLGFFGFAFLYLTAAFAELRFTGTPNVIDNKNSIAERSDLPGGITYLILDNMDSREVNVIGSDRAQLQLRSFAGNVLKNLKYKFSDGTLTISGLEEDDNKKVQITVFVPKSGFKGISVNSSIAIVEGLQQPHLQISENEGLVWISDIAVDRIEMDLSNKSFLDISTANLDTVSAKIDESQMYLSTPVDLVQASLMNKSFLQINEIQEIQLKKDASSNLNTY